MLDNNEWLKEPKLWVEETKVNWFFEFQGLEKYWVIAMICGSIPHVFALSPAHIKQFSEMLAYNVKEYEKKNGKIPVTWKPLVKSPLSREDFKKGPPADGIL